MKTPQKTKTPPWFNNYQKKNAESCGLLTWLPSAQYLQIIYYLLPWLKTVSWPFCTCWFNHRKPRHPSSSGVPKHFQSTGQRQQSQWAFYSVLFWNVLMLFTLLSCTCSRSGQRSSSPLKTSKSCRISVILPATPITSLPFALASPFPDSSCCQPKPEELPDYHLCWDVDWAPDFPLTQAIRGLPWKAKCQTPLVGVCEVQKGKSKRGRGNKVSPARKSATSHRFWKKMGKQP